MWPHSKAILDEVISVAISPDGKQLASASRDGTIRLWDVATGKNTATVEGQTSWGLRLVFSPNGKILASEGYDGKISLWDVHPEKE